MTPPIKPPLPPSASSTMIEDFIPVRQISIASIREKQGGHHLSRGQIRNLHLWWARRPLAACRAAVYAAFAPPSTKEEREHLPSFFAELCDYKGPILPETWALRKAREVVSSAAGGERPVVLDMFAGGGAIPLEALRLGAQAVAVDINPVAHLIQRCCLEFPQRYGARLRSEVKVWGEWVVAQTRSELADIYPDLPIPGNIDVKEPEAVNLSLYFGEDIDETGEVEEQPDDSVDEDADDEEGAVEIEPDADDDDPELTVPLAPGKMRPIAYLWTRTIPSTARGFEHAVVPLVRQTWLCKKPGNFVALRPIIDRLEGRVRFELVTSHARKVADAIAAWGFDPAGTKGARGATTCPFSGVTLKADDAKVAGKAGKMGVQLLAAVCLVAVPTKQSKPKLRKTYLAAPDVESFLPSDDDLQTRLNNLAALGLSVPDEPVQSEDRMNFKVPLYGMDAFGKLFTKRQLVTLLTFCKYTRLAHDRIKSQQNDDDFAAAIAAYLGLLVGRVADRGSMLCRWDNTRANTTNTYARQALPMIWDFSEACPFGGASGDAGRQFGYIFEVMEHCAAASPGVPARVIRAQAQKIPLDDDSVDAVITDPPYYDNISYADLSDFFYVWHKRALGSVFKSNYNTPITPKKPEIVAASHRHGKGKVGKANAEIFYETEMQKAFVEAQRVLKPGAPMIVVYAHKTTAGWATLINGLRGAGFEVSEAWPLATEMPGKVGWEGAAMLASSIFLVARKRPETERELGSYSDEVRPEMQRIVKQRVQDLMEAGISGADLVIAALGAGLRPFTKYERVELPSGEEITSQKFLEEVQREVMECILTQIFNVDRSGVGKVDQASRFYVLARYQYGEMVVEFGQFNVLAQGIGVELTGAGSLSDGRRKLLEQDKSKLQVLDYKRRGSLPLPCEAQRLAGPATATLPGFEGDSVAVIAPSSLIDVLHRLLWLMDNQAADVGLFLLDSGVDRGMLKVLAQSLGGKGLSSGSDARSEEQKAIDRLLARWSGIMDQVSLSNPSGGIN